MRRQAAFTLIELLVVIAIIAVLMAILMPALKRARLQGIRDGGLFKYIKNERLYKCPTGIRGEVVTYAIPDGMNGHRIADVQDRGLIITRRESIKNPGKRIVFLDEGQLTSSSWTIWYSQPRWWDQPTLRHGNGTNFAFADHHADYWKWNDPRTIEVAQIKQSVWQSLGRHDTSLSTQPGNDDLMKVQKGCWDKLGYSYISKRRGSLKRLSKKLLLNADEEIII